MEKAIEIKRRAQRCIQNGDLDGALSEYEKLVAIEDSDPYNLVLLADLLFKKGDTGSAGQRYLGAAAAYEKAGLYKNAIAVCKKLMRLQLAPAQVFQRLAALHALDGLGTEASLYFQQHAENLARDEKYKEAAESLRQAFEASNENIKALERLAEVLLLLEQREEAVRTLLKAAREYGRAGLLGEGERCRKRAHKLDPNAKEEDLPEEDVPASAAEPTATKSAHGKKPAPESAHGKKPAPEIEVEPPAPIELASDPDFQNHMTRASEASAAGATIADLESSSSHIPGPPRFDLSRSGGTPAPEPEPESEPAFSGAPSANGDAESVAAGADEEVEAEGESLELGIPVDDLLDPSPAAPAVAASPGLRFEDSAPSTTGASLGEVERMLSKAQECFRVGQREQASEALAGAARAYDALGRFDSAATIYRSLGKSAHATNEMLERWIENCERRGDRAEAAQVACELGDRALNEGHTSDARDWFERAREFDASNETSLRRLQRMSDGPANAGSSLGALDSMPETGRAVGGAAPGAGGIEPGRVEVAVGRGEAVTFDLGSLIAEFQRGVETQLSGDSQGHYDLAMSYREMGLLEQAVDSFRIAAADPAYGLRAMEMVGRCMLDQGRFDEAVEEFERALAQGGLDATARLSLHYELGLTHEAAGRPDRALAEFERVFADRPDFSDVRLKVTALRKTPGSA